MNNTPVIRVGRSCDHFNVWTTQVENGTVWHGFSMFVMEALARSLQADIKFVHETPDTGFQYDLDSSDSKWQTRREWNCVCLTPV